MKIKKFSAATIPEALTKVRLDMGSHAVILGTSRRRVRGSINVVEVVAAAGEEVKRMATLSGRQDKRPMALERMRNIDRDLLAELKAIEARLNEIAESVVSDAFTRKGGSVIDDLLQAGFDPLLLRDRIKLDRLASPVSLRNLISDLLGEVRIEKPIDRVGIFVGPAGAGKTTTVLKVARRYSEQDRTKPIVVFFGPKSARDVTWLRQQCKSLKLKFRVVTHCNDLERFITRQRSPILIDTPGLSEISDSDLRFLVGLSRQKASVRLHLVVEATMDPQNIYALASCIPGSPSMGLVLTKMDEAARIGGVLSAVLAGAMPLIYVTGGTQSSDGIFVPDLGIITDKVFESLEKSA